MSLEDLVAQLRSIVESARSMPMSSSAVVNRAEVLDLVGKLERALPSALAGQPDGGSQLDTAVADGQREPQRILAEAERERDRLVSESEVLRSARAQADQELATARAEAAELRADTDTYVDTRLATFEVTLTKVLEAVARGRTRLGGRSHFDALGESLADTSDGDDGSLTTPDELRSP